MSLAEFRRTVNRISDNFFNYSGVDCQTCVRTPLHHTFQPPQQNPHKAFYQFYHMKPQIPIQKAPTPSGAEASVILMRLCCIYPTFYVYSLFAEHFAGCHALKHFYQFFIGAEDNLLSTFIVHCIPSVRLLYFADAVILLLHLTILEVI